MYFNFNWQQQKFSKIIEKFKFSTLKIVTLDIDVSQSVKYAISEPFES